MTLSYLSKALLSNDRDSLCPFCGKIVLPQYVMNQYTIGCCKGCGTIAVMNMPADEELTEYYQGFCYNADVSNLRLVQTFPIKKWMNTLVNGSAPRDTEMLDVGGGGGFFAKVFEDFGLGKSTYIDIDAHACDFARNKLGLNQVYQTRATDYLCQQERRYKFIYCRHVAEHLVDPVELIHLCAKSLCIGGVFVLQVPNGISKEQALLYPERWRHSLAKTARENGWSKGYAYLFSLTPRYGFGLDPVRHLWAISPRAIHCIFQQNSEFAVEVSSHSLADPVFSPYYASTSRLGRVRDRFANIVSNVFGSGSHLVAVIKRQGAI